MGGREGGEQRGACWDLKSSSEALGRHLRSRKHRTVRGQQMRGMNTDMSEENNLIFWLLVTY